jgi:hypothetical protein
VFENPKYCKKTPKKSKKQRKTLADSFLSQLQPFQDWFQIELDELYRFHTLFFPIPPALVFKNPKKGKKQRKTLADSFLSQLQPFQDWFQIELDELYRFHTLFSPYHLPCSSKTQKTVKKKQKAKNKEKP